MRLITALAFCLGIAGVLKAESIVCDPTIDLGNNASAYIERSAACLGLMIEDRLRRNPDQALKDANRAVELAPERADAYAARAMSHAWRGSLGQAIADATVAIMLEPDNDQWYRERSFYMFQVDDLAGSLADLEQAIVVSPDEMDLYLFRSSTLEELGRTDEAIAGIQEAMMLFPDSAELIRRLGDLYFMTGQDQLALETYQRFNAVASEQSPLVNARLLILERRLSNG